MGADQHGQDATKAAVRACPDIIGFNGIPSIRDIVPGGYDNMSCARLGVPGEPSVDLGKVQRGSRTRHRRPRGRVRGGLYMAKSGIAIPEMGDRNDDFVIAVASITVGY